MANYNYQIVMMPSGKEVKIRQNTFSLNPNDVWRKQQERIRVRKEGEVYIFDFDINDFDSDELFNTAMGVLRQIKLEGHSVFSFNGKCDRVIVEYSIYAYRYTDDLELCENSFKNCQLLPQDEKEMKMLYELAKYLKHNNRILGTSPRPMLPPISPLIRKI